MVERSTIVTIGATLQSSFRTSFREARQEVDSLTRSLTGLTGRRSNAGLLGMRDATNQIRTAFRAMRTESTGVIAGLGRLETRLTRTSAAFGQFRNDAQGASRSLVTLSRNLDRLGNAGSQGLRSMQQATQALAAMTAATNQQIAAHRALAHSMGTPLPTPRGGGGGGYGGRGGHGGGHGGIGAAGTHAVMHAGFGAVGAGYLGGHMIKEMYSAGANYQHEVNQRRMQGWQANEIRDLEAQAKAQSRRVGTLSQRELMAMGGDLGFALGNREHAVASLGSVAESVALMKSANIKGSAENSAFGMVKALEQMGKTQDLPGRPGSGKATMESYMKDMTAATIATGGKVSGGDYLAFVNRAKGSASGGNMTQEFFTKIVPSLIQEMGGAQAGNAINQLDRALVGGHMTKEAAQTLGAMGLTVPDDTQGSTGSGVSGGFLGRMHKHGNWRSIRTTGRERIIDPELYRKDRGEWMRKYLGQGLKDEGVDINNMNEHSETKLQEILMRSFSSGTSMRMAQILLMQGVRLQKDRDMINNAVKAATLKQNAEDPTQGLLRMTTSWENLMMVITTNKGNMDGVTKAFNVLSDVMNKISDASPETISAFTQMTVGLVGMPVAAFAASRAFSFLRSGMGDVLRLARSPMFLGFAAAGYLIYKHWDWVKPFAENALPGLERGLTHVGEAFDLIVSTGAGILKLFGIIPRDTDATAKALGDAAEKGKTFGKALEVIVPLMTALWVGNKVMTIATSMYALAKGIGAAEAAASGGMLGTLLRALGLAGGAAAAAAALPAATMNWAEGQGRKELEEKLAKEKMEKDKAAGKDTSVEGYKQRFQDMLRKRSSFEGSGPGGLLHNAAYISGGGPRTGSPYGNTGLLQNAAFVTGANDNRRGGSARGSLFDPYGNTGLIQNATWTGGNGLFGGGDGGGGGGGGGGSGFQGSGGIQGGGRRGFMGVGNGPTGAGSNGGRHMGDVMKGLEAQLIKEGLSPEAAKAGAAALGGSVIQESGGDPTKVHDHGTGYGIYGARLDRRTKMLNWLRANGYAADSAEGQARYMAHEAMTGGYKSVAAALRGANAGNLGQVADIVTRKFESPAAASANYQGRINNAYNLYRRGGQNAPGVSDKVAGVMPSGGSLGSIADKAQSLLGANAQGAGAALGHGMTAGLWCADFVNGVLKSQGIRGTGSSASASFRKFGQAVGTLNEIKKGDILVEGGHVGIATGERDARGRIGMVSGNYSHKVSRSFEDPGKIQAVRRAAQANEAIASAAGRARKKGGTTIHNNRNVNAPITVQAMAHHDENQIASLAADHIRRHSDDAADLRSGTFDHAA